MFARSSRWRKRCSREDPDRELWFSDPTPAAVSAKWSAGAGVEAVRGMDQRRKRFQGGARAEIPVVEDDGTKLKFNPFANVSRERSRRSTKWQNFRRIAGRLGLPVGRLHAVLEPNGPGEDARAGRWRARPRENVASIRRRLLRTTPLRFRKH